MSYNYNEISLLYDDVREADVKAVEFLIKTSGIGEKSSFLEVGCGTGNYLRLLEKLTGARAFGIDQSVGMLSKAREKSETATLIHGDAVLLNEIPDDSFHLIYMVDVIHHIKDIHTMFENLKKKLRPNGTLVIFSDSHEHIRNRLTSKYFPETLPAELNRYQDASELISALEAKGYQQVKSGTLKIGVDPDFAPKLIEIAKKKGYSMFGLIPESAITEGIQRIEKDLQEKKEILYHQQAPYVIARK